MCLDQGPQCSDAGEARTRGLLFDARKPVIRICDAVALSHVHAATLRVYTGENVRASQRLHLLFAALIEYFSSIYRWHESMFTVSCG